MMVILVDLLVDVVCFRTVPFILPIVIVAVVAVLLLVVGVIRLSSCTARRVVDTVALAKSERSLNVVMCQLSVSVS